MKIQGHILTSAGISGVLYFLLRSVPGALTCFIVGVFIDLDHLLDYAVNHGPRLRWRHFFAVFREHIFTKVLVLLHAWEWVLLLLGIVWLTDRHPASVGAFIGFLSHMVLDKLTNENRPGAYFITWRLLRGFAAEAFLPPEEIERMRRRDGGDAEERQDEQD
jgi:hypothetical protein